MTKIECDCSACSASFAIQHIMNDERYEPEHCPFCGTDSLDYEEIEDVEDENEA